MLISSYSRRSIGLRPPLATFDCRRTFFRRKCSIHFVENSKLMESREDRPLAFLSSSFYWFRVPSLAPQFLNLPRIQIRCSASWNIRLEVFFVWRHSCFAAGASYSWLRAYCFLRGSYFFPSNLDDAKVYAMVPTELLWPGANCHCGALTEQNA